MKIGNPNDAVLEMEKIKRAFSFDKNDIKLFLQHYKDLGKYAGEGSNRISYSDFLQGLSLPDSSLLREVFSELCGESVRGKTKVTRQKVDEAMSQKEEQQKKKLLRRIKDGISELNAQEDNDDEVVVVPEPAIHLDEFLQACMAIINIDGSEKNIQDIFTSLDISGDRRLSADELKAALATISPDVTTFQVRQLLAKFRSESVSVAGRDEVDYIEFAGFLRNNPLFLKVFSVMLKQGSLKKIKNEAQRTMDVGRWKPLNEE